MRIRGAMSLQLSRGAIENARRALDEVERSVRDRAALHDAGLHRLVSLSRNEAVELLQSRSVGRLAYVARAGVPDIVPVNYAWCEAGAVIRSGPGPKLQAAKRGDVVALEVDELDEERRSGASVVVVGRASVVDPRSVDADVEPWAGGPRRSLILIRPTRVEGRRLE